jgi:integrase
LTKIEQRFSNGIDPAGCQNSDFAVDNRAFDLHLDQTNNREAAVSYREYVLTETKNLCHVRETASGSLQAILRINGRTYSKTKKNTQEGADWLIRWINQTYAVEATKGLIRTPEDRRPYTVLDVIKEYREHPTPKRNPKARLSVSDLKRLGKLAADPIAKVSLADEGVLVNAANRYANKLKATLEMTSVRREIAIYKAMFNMTKRECWFTLTDIPNPFGNIRLYIDKDEYAGTRAVLSREDEYRILMDLKTLQGSNKVYYPLAFQLALHTGLRLGVIFKLRFGDVNLETRRIDIKKDYDKDRKPRIIPMSVLVKMLFIDARAYLIKKGKQADIAKNALIFPPSDYRNRHGTRAENRLNAFTTSFERRVKALGLYEGRDKRDRLTAKSLRRIARVRLVYHVKIDNDLVKHMMGHSLKEKIDLTHYDSQEHRNKVIQEQLDKYYFHGRSEEEERQHQSDMKKKANEESREMLAKRRERRSA